MKRILFYIIRCICLLPLLASCDVDGELPSCPYSVKIDYTFTADSELQMLADYISTLTEYLFDDRGVLVGVNSGVRCAYGSTQYSLTPGKTYTLVTWGNQNNYTRCTPYTLGQTTQDELLLSLQAPETAANPTGWQRQADKLYYGYATFTVPPTGVLHQIVELSQVHANLTFTFRWVGRPPTAKEYFNLRLCQMSGTFTFAPGVQVEDKRGGKGVLTLPTSGDGLCNHRLSLYTIDDQPEGNLTTFRFTSAHHPLLRLYDGDKPMMKEVDLHRFFSEMEVDLDHALRQDYALVIEINGDNVFVMFADLGGWDEGESIGGSAPW